VASFRPRWNKLSPDTDGISKIRKQLFKISDGYCSYCGKFISIEEMDVDHYLMNLQHNLKANHILFSALRQSQNNPSSKIIDFGAHLCYNL
jgi:5-methylcytosine-specific restriction endonuclease McrA